MMNFTLNCAITRARLRLLQVAYQGKDILGELVGDHHTVQAGLFGQYAYSTSSRGPNCSADA
jgi:hypothetical protein